MRASPNRPQQFTGRHMLMAMLGFFGVIVTVNVVMAVSASTTWTGLVVPNSYVASQEFQAKQDAAVRQRALGWHAELAFADGRISLTVVDGAGLAIELGKVTLQVNRPVGGHDDQQLVLARSERGAYEAPLQLASGVWELNVTAAETPEGPFALHERLVVRKGASS